MTLLWFIGAPRPRARLPALAALGTAIDYLVEHTSAETRG